MNIKRKNRTSKDTTKIIKSGDNKNLVVMILSAVVITVIALLIFLGLKTALATESYYVLTKDVPAKTLVTKDILKEIVTSKGSAPQNAISIQQVNKGGVYTRYPLKAGDILTESTTGLDLDSSAGIPDDWVITSFTIPADHAAGGNIRKGDYFDVIAVSPDEGAKYVFYNLLALDVQTSEQDSKVTDEGKVVPIGEQIQYIVGMPPDKAPILQLTFAKYDNVRLVLSPKSLQYKDLDTSTLNGTYTVGNSGTDLFKGTDNAFTPVLRDKKGVPVNAENCSKGLVSPRSMCDDIKSKNDNKKESTKNDKKNDKTKTENNDKTEDTDRN